MWVVPAHLGAGGSALYPGCTLAMCGVCSYMYVWTGPSPSLSLGPPAAQSQ